MNGNYEWNKQMTQQRLQKRYAEAELSRQLKQEGGQRHGQFRFTSALSAVWRKLQNLRWNRSNRPVSQRPSQRAQHSQS